jgi:Mg/Co/Ni transporter MgtE
MSTKPIPTTEETVTSWNSAIARSVVCGLILGCIFGFAGGVRQNPVAWLIFGLVGAPTYAVKPGGRRTAAVAIMLATGSVLAAVILALAR